MLQRIKECGDKITFSLKRNPPRSGRLRKMVRFWAEKDGLGPMKAHNDLKRNITINSLHSAVTGGSGALVEQILLTSSH